MSIVIGYSEAVSYLSNNTYLLEEDAARMVKLMIHTEKFKKQIGRLPTKDELVSISEFVRNDKSRTYFKESFTTKSLNNLIQSVNSTPPKINN